MPNTKINLHSVTSAKMNQILDNILIKCYNKFCIKNVQKDAAYRLFLNIKKSVYTDEIIPYGYSGIHGLATIIGGFLNDKF
ncbi:MAG: hypothetical protein EGR16_00920 [Clostridiales bacterium]|nr:hypothetical protein [Clostridiales bacterium]